MTNKKWILNVNQFDSEYAATVSYMISLYIQAFHDFFEMSPTKDENEFFSVATQRCEKKSDELFLLWIKDKGLVQLKKVLELNLPFDSTIKSKLDLVVGTLNDELQWEDRDKKSTRSTIINTLSNLSEKLIHLSTLSLEKEEMWFNGSQLEKTGQFGIFNKNRSNRPDISNISVAINESSLFTTGNSGYFYI